MYMCVTSLQITFFPCEDALIATPPHVHTASNSSTHPSQAHQTSISRQKLHLGRQVKRLGEILSIKGGSQMKRWRAVIASRAVLNQPPFASSGSD